MKQTIYILLLTFIQIQASAQICPGTPGQILWECWQNLYDDEIEELHALPNYPLHPDVVQTRYQLASPSNYDNYMGGRMRGYIYVPSNETVTFNLTGNQEARFYLSTDANPDNKVLIAYLDEYSDIEEHDKYPSQTSTSIALSSGQDYYFEVEYAEGGGYDHAVVWWKTDLVNPTEWNVITAGFLKGVACLPDACPEAGVACDDADASTTNDIQDGYCNCFGTPSSTNVCIGDRGLIESYRYDTIPGGDLNDLYNSPNFPAMPDYSQALNFLGLPRENVVDGKGNLVQGYLTVPISGNYKFNVTGDDQTILFISSDETPENKQTHQVFVSSWTNMTEHDKFIWQSTGNIYLEAGNFYYVEMNSKEGGGSEHFSAFWQAPFTEPGVWKRIPKHYIYDYAKDCELACIAEFKPCDDGDPFTNNDMYNDNCECVGTPCSGPDCDSPLANYIPYDKCSVTDQIDNNKANNWLSCEVTDSPNAARERSHWIQYDLQVKHEVYQSQIWNYNEADEEDQGFEMVAIDYSLDGSTWTELGTYNWPLASGDSNYAGFSGPDFQGTEARYILITSLDDTTTCRGLGKVAFTAVSCPGLGTLCDDGDPNTINDAFDDNCLCVGTNVYENDCEDMMIVLGDTLLSTEKFSAVDYVQSVSEIDAESKVSFVGGNSVTLNVGFETQANTVFIAAIDTCEIINNAREEDVLNRRMVIADKLSQQAKDIAIGLQVNSIEGTDIQEIKFYVDQPGLVTINLLDKSQKVVYTLVNHEYENKGLYKKRLRTKKLDQGVYTVQYQSASLADVERLMVE